MSDSDNDSPESMFMRLTEVQALAAKTIIGPPSTAQYMTRDTITFYVDDKEIIQLEKDRILVRGELAATNTDIVEGLRYFVHQAYASLRSNATAQLLELPQDERARAVWRLLESLDSDKRADLLSRFELEHPQR
jgi:hypothetical protein